MAVIAEPLHLADEDVKHLVLTRVMMRWDREPGRIRALHDTELPECILGGGLDDHASSAPVVGGTLVDTVNVPTHREHSMHRHPATSTAHPPGPSALSAAIIYAGCVRRREERMLLPPRRVAAAPSYRGHSAIVGIHAEKERSPH
jgi:hypothetical protein